MSLFDRDFGNLTMRLTGEKLSAREYVRLKKEEKMVSRIRQEQIGNYPPVFYALIAFIEERAIKEFVYNPADRNWVGVDLV